MNVEKLDNDFLFRIWAATAASDKRVGWVKVNFLPSSRSVLVSLGWRKRIWDRFIPPKRDRILEKIRANVDLLKPDNMEVIVIDNEVGQ